jgi:predicted MPP superfamily phosphohydrolase
LPPAWDGLRLLHITDLHISNSLPVSFVEKLVAEIQKLKADLIVYTGDILDSQAIRHLSEFGLLKTIRPPLGNFYVPGNHEYYWEIDQGLAAFRSIDFTVLVNETATLQRDNQLLQISGIPDPAALMFKEGQLEPGSFRLMLSHQPSLADKTCDLGYQLQLSGHTHGGQFFPWNFLIGFFQKYAKGLYRIKNMQLYVNQGTGYWGPSLRMGTYCEITEIILRKQ